MKYANAICCFVLLGTGCSGNASGPGRDPVAATTSKQAAENFEQFLERFAADSGFQQSRIVYPILAEMHPDRYDSESITVDTIARNGKEWGYSDFKALGKKYLSKIYASPEADTLQYSGKDNGISVKYIFQLRAGKWMLVTIIDEST